MHLASPSTRVLPPFPASVIIEPVNFDTHRDSLTKYCYDLSKVTLAVTVINPVVTKSLSLIELVAGLLVSVGLLLLAILIEHGKTP